MNDDLINEMQSIINFVKELDNLKNQTRTAWTSNGREESVAEHSWRLGIFALSLEPYFPNIDISKLVQMCLIHDFGEAYDGDISATIKIDPKEKLKNEEISVNKLISPLCNLTQDKIISLWNEYNEGITEEAKIAKALDKMETIIQHNQGDNPDEFNYQFNLDYGKEYSQSNNILKTIRKIIDEDTMNKI